MAAITPYMGLKVWNLLNDSFDHVQLAENFAKIDQHNHAEGKGNQIPTGGIVNGAISTEKLGEDVVTDAKILKAPIRGIINSSNAAIVSGSGFTASGSAGNITITFSPALPTAPTIQITQASAGGGYVSGFPTTTSANVITVNSAGTTTASIFHFIAYPQ